MLVALCVASTLLLGAVYARVASPLYEATSVLRLETEQVNLPQLVQQISTENRIGTEMEVLRGRSAAMAVIDSLGLRAQIVSPRSGRVSAFFSTLHIAAAADTGTIDVRLVPGDEIRVTWLGRPAQSTRARIGDTVRTGGVTLVWAPSAGRASGVRMRILSPEQALREFDSRLRISRPGRDVDLIDIQVRNGDPVIAAAAANLLANNRIAGRQEVQQARTAGTIEYLRSQLDTLGIRLRVAEDTLRAYREHAGVVDAEAQASTQVQRLTEVQANRAAVQAERDALLQLIQQIRSDSSRLASGGSSSTSTPISFPTLLRNPATSQLLGALATAQNERASLLVRRTPRDPDVVALTDRITEINGQLKAVAETYLQGLSDQVTALNTEASSFSGTLDSLPKKEVEAARLQRDVTAQQDLYTLIQTRLKEAEITQSMKDPTLHVVDAAVVPDRPVQPVMAIVLATALVLGGLLGIGAAVGREMADEAVRSRADASSATGLPVLGAIPRVEERRRLRAIPHRVQRLVAVTRGRTAASPQTTSMTGARGRGRGTTAQITSMLVTRPDASAVFVESFNQLHASLALAHHDRKIRSLVFTSALPSEGKTVLAINYALTGAARGLRVLLIDADIRCGLINQVFDVSREPGFAELLRGSASIDSVVRHVTVDDATALAVMPAGRRSVTSARLQTTERIRSVLESVLPQFDLIVIDSPPVNLLADAAVLGSAADAVVVVARPGRTDMSSLRYAMDQLDAAHAPVIGTVLNDIDLRHHARDDGSYRYLAEVDRYYVVN